MTAADAGAPGYAISCQEMVELITDYLEGALDAELTAEVAAHLDVCEGCAVYLDQIRATIRTAGRVPVATLGEDAQAELLRAFRDLRRPGPTVPQAGST